MKNVLVVEDNQMFQKLIAKKLLQHELVVFSADSVGGALEKLADNKIDVVWLDHYLLGNGDGLDLVTAMKKQDCKYKSIPIFVVSNSADHDKTSAYLRLGVEKYYVKSSVSLSGIIDDIKEFLINNEK